jgi:hypothetical protein
MGLFKKSTPDKFIETPLTKSQKAADELQQSLVERDINIPTQQVAGLSGLEQQGLTQAGGLANIDSAALAQSSADVLQQTLSGGFDPRTSPFFQGLRAESERLKQEGISDTLRRSQQLTGAPSSVALRQAGEVGARFDENTLQTLGGLFEQERGRQFQAIGAGFNAPGAIAQTLLGAGQVPRSIEQQILNAQFAQRQAQELAPFQYQNPIASDLLSQQRMNFIPGQQGSSLFQDIAGVAGIASGLGGLGAAGAGMLGAGGGLDMFSQAGGLFGGGAQTAGKGLASGIGSFLFGKPATTPTP